MPWVYAIKRTMPSSFGEVPCYFKSDGKFNGSMSQAKEFETREEAETKAFLLVTKHPEWIGRLSVVRWGQNLTREQ